jgi:hypothetical protein
LYVQASTVVTLPAVAAAVVVVAMVEVATVSSGKCSNQQAITLSIIQVPHPSTLLY